MASWRDARQSRHDALALAPAALPLGRDRGRGGAWIFPAARQASIRVWRPTGNGWAFERAVSRQASYLVRRAASRTADVWELRISTDRYHASNTIRTYHRTSRTIGDAVSSIALRKGNNFVLFMGNTSDHTITTAVSAGSTVERFVRGQDVQQPARSLGRRPEDARPERVSAGHSRRTRRQGFLRHRAAARDLKVIGNDAATSALANLRRGRGPSNAT